MAPAVHAASGAVLQAVASRDVKRARSLTPRGRVHESYESLITDPEVDAVYVGLANAQHLPWTRAAILAGRPVLCEKPLALSASDVGSIAAASAATGAPVVEAVWSRWHPALQAVLKLVAAGTIGIVRHVEAELVVPAPQSGYRLDPVAGGGALYDLGVYVAFVVLAAFAGQHSAVASASLHCNTERADHDAAARLHFATGDAWLHVAFGPPAQRLVITGDDGRIVVDGGPFVPDAGWEARITVVDADGSRVLSVACADALRLMVEWVGERLRAGDRWWPSLADSWACASVIDRWRAAATAATAMDVDSPMRRL